jgi:hypothetical protein
VRLKLTISSAKLNKLLSTSKKIKKTDKAIQGQIPKKDQENSPEVKLEAIQNIVIFK